MNQPAFAGFLYYINYGCKDVLYWTQDLDCSLYRLLKYHHIGRKDTWNQTHICDLHAICCSVEGGVVRQVRGWI